MKIGQRVQIIGGRHSGRTGRVNNHGSEASGEQGVKLDKESPDAAQQFAMVRTSDMRKIEAA